MPSATVTLASDVCVPQRPPIATTPYAQNKIRCVASNHRENTHHQPFLSAGALSSRPPQHIRRPLYLTQHDTVARDIAPLDSVDHVRQRVLRRLEDHLAVRQRNGLVSTAEDVGGGDVAPACVRGAAPVDADALGEELRGPVFCRGRGQVVVEGFEGFFRVYGCDAGLE